LSDEGLSWGEMEKEMANEDRETLRRNPENEKNLPPPKKRGKK